MIWRRKPANCGSEYVYGYTGRIMHGTNFFAESKSFRSGKSCEILSVMETVGQFVFFVCFCAVSERVLTVIDDLMTEYIII